MKRGGFSRITFLAFGMLLAAGPLQAEVIRMTDGTLYQGQIVKQTRFVLTIRLPDGRIKRLLRKEVADVMSDAEARESQQKQDASNERTQSEGTASNVPVTEEQRALIQRLMQVSGTQQALLSLYETLLNKASPQDRETIQQRFNLYELLDRLVPVYARIYTEEELRELIQFYSSPLGQKMLKNSPTILEQSFQETLTYLMSLLNHESPAAEPQRQGAGNNSK